MTRKTGIPPFVAGWILWVVLAGQTAGIQLPLVDPGSAGVDPEHLQRMEPLIASAIGAGETPGCVVCLGRRGKIFWLRAFGNRQVLPEPEPMTVDTVFDLASLTKPVATATAVMLLAERGQLRLEQPAADHLPGFGTHGKEEIRIRDLLLHCSGLIADNPLEDYAGGPDEAWRKICELEPTAAAGGKFVYSDVNFMVLGELVGRISGQRLDRFVAEAVFQPLGMRDTGFLPAAELRGRTAPTGQRDGKWMRGEVHDPRAHALGGVAGHAGLFSTAGDLALFADMMLGQGLQQEPAGGKGTGGPKRILGPATVIAMTRGQTSGTALRGLGWDKRSAYSSNRGDLLGEDAYGHGGFTGTVLWIDPQLDLFFIFLGNRLHPDGAGTINPLAGRLLNIAASAVKSAPRAAGGVRPPVLNGIDVLERDGFRAVAGQRIGLITNQTGRNLKGQPDPELLLRAPGIQLTALFSPEHGIAGSLDEARIGHSTDPVSGLPVYSLYSETRRPTAEMLEGVDTLVFDIQDIGTRYYTYLSTMGESMVAAAAAGKRFVVLDRPNPINGVDVAGPMLDAGRESFTGWHSLPVRHGMTAGELACMIRDERKLDLDLQVIPCEGWTREMWWDETGLTWVHPSPNMRSLTGALLYPGMGLLETTNLSVGRGTDTPFEVMGAPWIDARELAARLNGLQLPGIAFVPVEFVPDSSVYAGETCRGVHLVITDRSGFDPLLTGFSVAATLHRLWPGTWQIGEYLRLLGNRAVFERLCGGADGAEAVEASREGMADFLLRRQKFLLYR